MNKSTSFFVLGLLIGVAAAGGWFAWLGASTDGGDASVRVLKLAHGLPTNHSVHRGLVEFGKRLEERSGGKLKVAVYPNEQLGNETQCLEKVQSGTIDITKTAATAIGNFVPAYKVFGLPYLFRDEDHYWKVLSGPVGEKMLDLAGTREDGADSGLHGLGYFDSGSRSFYTKDPVRSPADLVGKKIRVMNDQVSMDMVKAMGGSPTPISFGELYTALKQGTVDGAENNPPSFVSSRHYEICKYYVLDHHSRIPDVIVASSQLWKSLNGQERVWMREAMADATAYHKQLWKEDTDSCMDLLRKEGVTVFEPELSGFRKAVAPIIGKYTNETTAPLIKSIQDTE